MSGVKHSTEYTGVVQQQFIASHIHDYLPILDYPDRLPEGQERFTLRDVEGHPATKVDPGNMGGRHLLQRMAQDGLLEVCRESTGDRPAAYRWRPEGRAAIQEYLESVEQLSCGCRQHIPDTRDDPEGIISCKYCGQEYPADRFRELLTDF